MSEIPVPDIVAGLLSPINNEAPTGEDIAKSDDPVANAAYSDLEMEITKHGNIDYQKTTGMATEILENRSKHIRVAAWLCLSWFRTEGADGLKNGLILILQLLKTFGEKLFPEKPAHRSKAIQFISLDKRFQTLEKTEISDSGVLNIIKEIFGNILDECKKQFPENPPDLSQLSAVIENCLKTPASGTPAQEDPAESKPDEKEPEQTSPETTELEETDPVKEIEIPADVAELLEDISSENPAGEDIENTEDQDAQVIYMQLESEIMKYSGNKYPECMKWAQEILRNRNKHLRVALWLCVSWYKLEKLSGFRNGLQLLCELLKKYGSELHPADSKQKSKIVQTLNAETRIKVFDKEKIDQSNSELILEIGELFSALKEQADIHLNDVPPKLNVIQGIIEDKVTDARNILDQNKKAAQQAEKVEQTAQPPARPAPAAPKQATTTPVTKTLPPEGDLHITDDKNAKIAIKNALKFYFMDETANPPKKKISEDPTIYALSRNLRWGKLVKPEAKEKVTQVEGPNKVKQEFILKHFNEKNWETLIPDLETNFIINEAFTFWLDAQRYVVHGLEKKDDPLTEVAAEIKAQIARLVTKLPGLTNLVFKDGKTPFATKETIEWIKDDVMSSFGSVKSKEKILPPIMGEDYAPINKEYEEACETLPDNFAENARAMQQAIDGETRKKGRFLRLLNLANYCYLANKSILAQPLFDQLMEQIENYHITEWETALCVSVWQSAYINNAKLISAEEDDQKKSEIEKNQKDLFNKIVKYDAVLALSLEEYKQNEGE